MVRELDLLRAEKLLHQAESAGEAILDVLGAEDAVIDSSGCVIAVNEAWKRLALSRGDESLAGTGLGQNYLDFCEKAAEAGVTDAAKALAGLRDVLRRSSIQFVMEYEVATQGHSRWFVLTVTSLAQMSGALISHRDITARRQVEEALRLGGQVEIVSSMLESFLPALVKNLSTALSARHAFLSEVVDSKAGRVRLLAHWVGTEYGELMEYDVAGTPCELVLTGEVCIFPHGIQKLFPADEWFKQIGAESYCAVPLLDSSGTPLGHLGVIDPEHLDDLGFVETTLRVFAAPAIPELERRKVERQLADQSRLIFSAPDAIVATDVDFRITYWSEAAERTYGWRAEEVLGLKAMDVLRTEFSDEARAEGIRTLNESGKFRGESVHHRKDGSPIDIEATARAFRDRGGRVTGYVSINRDISERVQAQRALRQAEAKNEAILKAIPDIVFTVDGRGRFLTFSPAKDFQPLIPPSEFLGSSVVDVLPAELAQRILKAIGTALRTGEAETLEYQLVRDGVARDHETRLIPIGEDEVLGIVRDYTTQKRHERELEERFGRRGLGERAVRRTGEKPCILVVDRDMQSLRFVKRVLEENGKRLVVAADPDEALGLMMLEQPDVVLLEVACFEGGASSLPREIHRFSDAPIVALGSADHGDGNVLTLKQGADDYITKPFSAAELDARVELALRHRQPSGPAPLRFDGLLIDAANRLVTLNGEEVDLTPTEYRLLLELALSAGKVLTHDEILDRVWGPGYAGEYEVLRSFIRTLRHKLGDDARRPLFLLSEYGVGYRMVKASG